MADTLTTSSRNFYERVKMKALISIVVSCAGLMLLGFCSIAAGQSSANEQREDNVDEDDQQKVYSALAAGYGFASFIFVVSFIILVGAAIFISPLLCGSNNERKMFCKPQELDSNYQQYSDSDPAGSGPVVHATEKV